MQLVLGLPGGAISDRLDRRRTMIVCDTARGVVLALLAALVLLHLVTWPVVLIVAVIDGGANVLFNPSASAALPGIVADEQLERAWAATEARTYAASLAGPALGGFLFGLGRAVPFIARRRLLSGLGRMREPDPRQVPGRAFPRPQGAVARGRSTACTWCGVTRCSGPWSSRLR